MSGVAKMRRIEISIRDGAQKKLFLVPAERAEAIETLLRDASSGEEGLLEAGELFPDLRKSRLRPFVTFRGIRAKTGMTQEQLAQKLKITQADVSKIESGKRPIGKALAKKIERAFGIDYRRFL